MHEASCVRLWYKDPLYASKVTKFVFVVLTADQPTAQPQANGTGWELALVTAPSSNESATAASKLVYFSPYFSVS